MEKISEEKCINLLIENFPKFITYWDAYTSYWGKDQGFSMKMIPFSKYVAEVIKSNNSIEIKKIFDLVESLFCNGDQSVRNAVATVFLEYLLSKDPDEIKFKTYGQYLGENSLEYCRAWDKFCGVRTEGLWDDEKNG